MSNHTPGPWKAIIGQRGSHLIRHDGKYSPRIVATVPPAEGWSLAHQDGNANLIAAAPELLEALKWVEGSLKATGEDLGIKDEDNEMLSIVRSAIAKAEGRS